MASASTQHQQVRHRIPFSERDTTTTMADGKEVENSLTARAPGGGLTASNLIRASPSQQGKVLKLKVPLLYSILPAFLQRIIARWNLLSCWAPQWKQRYLILLGGYLYKFQDSQASAPKGSPLPMDTVECDIVYTVPTTTSAPSSAVVDKGDDGGLQYAIANLPVGYQAVIRVSTFRRTHYYATLTVEDARVWIHSLQQARQETITRNLGHAKNIPYPKAYQYFDHLAKSLSDSKDRVKAKLEEHHAREMEMITLGDGAGTLPRAYFG